MQDAGVDSCAELAGGILSRICGQSTAGGRHSLPTTPPRAPTALFQHLETNDAPPSPHPPRNHATPTPQTASDYGTYLANEASPLFTSTIVDRCTRKLVDDWNAMRCQADEKLARFLDFCTYGHMIDNVVLIVTGALHERDVQVRAAGARVRGVCFLQMSKPAWRVAGSTRVPLPAPTKLKLITPPPPQPPPLKTAHPPNQPPNPPAGAPRQVPPPGHV